MDIKNDWKYHRIGLKFPFNIKKLDLPKADKEEVLKEYYKVQYLHVQYQLAYYEAKTKGNYLSEINTAKRRLERLLSDHSEWLV